MNPNIITHALNGILMVAMPIGLAIYLTRRFNLGWRLWLIGAAGFFLSQVGHIPFNIFLSNVLQRTTFIDWFSMTGILVNAAIGGLSAGLWEELTRYGVMRWWARDARSWHKGILLGAGHGGLEAILLGIYVLVVYFQLMAYRGTDLSTVVPQEQLALAQRQVDAYWSSPWHLTLLGAVERAMSIPAQIAFAVIVLQAFIRRQSRWVWIAVGLHALTDAIAVGIVARLYGGIAAEVIVALTLPINLAIIFLLRSPEPIPVDEVQAPLPAPVIPSSVDLRETREKLDQTRYN
jgi:uncharacterized membrane protein YhfC